MRKIAKKELVVLFLCVSCSANNSSLSDESNRRVGVTATSNKTTTSSTSADSLDPNAVATAPTTAQDDPIQMEEGDSGDDQAPKTPPPDTRPPEQILCETGPAVVAAAGKGDFSKQWAVICDGSKPTQEFNDALAQAFDGTGEPQIRLLKSTTSKNFVTEIQLLFAIKTTLKDPSFIIGLKPHDAFAAGVLTSNSDLRIDVKERKAFPAQSTSVERIILNYDLRTARGAGIYDLRSTEVNNYQLSDVRKEVSVGTEHLLAPEKNEYYHDVKGLMVAIAPKENETYMVFLNHLHVKNRIDPTRLQNTLLDLNTLVARMLYQHVTEKSAPATDPTMGSSETPPAAGG